MANNYIRAQAKLANIKLWEIADELNISDTMFSKMLRKELSQKEMNIILSAIKKIKEYKEFNDELF